MPERVPRDWRRLVRRHLPRLPVSGEREAEITEELAQLLRDASEDAGIDPQDERAVRAWLRSAIPRWRELAGAIADQERSLVRGDVVLATGSPKRRQLMVGLRNDFRYALRMLRRSPVLAAVVVLTLALGIGLNSAVFSLINEVVLKPLPVRDEGDLVRVFSQVPGGFLSHEPFAYPDFVDLRAQADGLEEIAGYAMMFAAIDSDGRAAMGTGEMVTGSYFSTLGVRPGLGRLLDEDDDRRGDPQSVVVLSYRTWQRRFGGERSVVGREIVVNGQTMTVVGVAPKGFRGLLRGLTPELWMPITTAIEIGASPMQNAGTGDPELGRLDNRKLRWLWVAGRRASGVGFDQVLAEIATVGRRLEQQYPDSNEDRALVALPLSQVKVLPGIDTGLYTASGLLMSVVGLVLLIASLNLANLLIARAVTRRREMATRLSLGAGRLRIVRQLLIESLLLAGLGAVAGLLVAWISNRGLSRLEVPFTVPISVDVGLDARVVGFTLLLATATALVFGLAPALEALRTDLSTVMRNESARGGGSVWRRRFQGGLVVAQVTFSLLLLVFAGLSLRSLLNASSIDPGFDPRGVVAATLTPGFQGYEDDEVTTFFERLRESLSAEPGVESVSLPSHLPLMLWINTWSVIPEGREDLPREEWFEVDTASVDSDYFETMRIPLVEGRPFLEEEGRESRRVIVVNNTLARRFWPGERALGKRIRAGLESEPYEVIGIATDGKYRTLGEEARPFAYTPIPPDWSVRTAVVRFARPESASPAAVARVVREIDEHLAISNLGTVSEVIAPSLLLPRLGAVLFGLLGAVGLILAAIGLYGVLAYYVGQRRHEIGLRVAVGAARWDIVRLVIRQGLLLTAVGTVLGVVLSLLGSRALVQVLYGIGPHDLVTFTGVVGFLLLVALAACYLPARRATKVDPIEALRYE